MADKDFDDWKHKKRQPLTESDLVEFFKSLLNNRDYPYFQLLTFLTRFKKEHAQVATRLFKSPPLIRSIIESITKPSYCTLLLYFLEFNVEEVEDCVIRLLQKEKTYELQREYDELKKYESRGQTNRPLQKDVSARIWDLVYMVSEKMRMLDIDVNHKVRWLCMLRGKDSEEMTLISRLLENIKKQNELIKKQKTFELLKDGLCGANNIAILLTKVDKPQSWSAALAQTIKNHPDPATLLNTLFFSCYPPDTLKIVADAFQLITRQSDILTNVFKDFVIPRLFPNLAQSTHVQHMFELIRSILHCGDKLQMSEQQAKLDKFPLNKKHSSTHKQIIELTKKKLRGQSVVENKSTIKQAEKPETNRYDVNRYNKQESLNSKLSHKSSTQYISYQSNDFIGLPNSKNDCYIISFVISLYFIKEFKQFFQDQQVKDKALKALQRLYKAIDKKQIGDLPDLLLQFKQQLPPQFSDNNQQHDAMSFGRVLFQKITSQPSISVVCKNLFELRYKQLIICPDSHESSRSQTIETNVILSFEKQLNYSIQSMIEQYFKKVRVQNDFKCQKCNRRFKYCTKQTVHAQFPQIFIVALNRSEYNKVKNQSKKIIQKVQIKDQLHLRDMKFLNGSIHYRLNGFINHLGDKMESGHYQAYVRHPETRSNWIWIDDDQVKEIECSKLQNLLNSFGQSETPSILFYKRFSY